MQQTTEITNPNAENIFLSFSTLKKLIINQTGIATGITKYKQLIKT